MTGSYSAALLVVLGLFLAGGAFSLARQGVPKTLIAVTGICSVMALAAGALRWR